MPDILYLAFFVKKNVYLRKKIKELLYNMKILIFTLLAVYFIVYVLSMTEIIGGWYLTKKYQGVKWDVKLTIIYPLVVPFLAFFDADIQYHNAEELYQRGKANTHHHPESLLAYMRHNKMTIDQCYRKKMLKKMFEEKNEP